MSKNVIRLAPALSINATEVDFVLKTFDQVLSEMKK